MALIKFPTLPVHFDIALKDVTVVDEGNQKWIKGEIEIKAGVAGKNIDEHIPFKTLNAVKTNFPIPGIGGSIDVMATLKDPHQVCASADLNWGPLHPHTGEHCIKI